MDVPEQSQLLEILRGRRDAIADRWYQAVARSGRVPQVAEVPQSFVKLAERAVAFLVAESPEHSEALAIGAALARLCRIQPEALGKTQEILAQCIAEGLSADQVVVLRAHLAALLGGIAAGFSQQAQETILTEQEAIRHTWVSELQSAQGAQAVNEQTVELAKASHELQTEIAERKRTEAALQKEEALERRNRDLELLNRAGQVFNSTLNLDQMLATALEELRRLLEVAACSVWLFGTQETTDGLAAPRELVCQQATGARSDLVRGWRLPPGEGVAGWVARHGAPLNVPDTRVDARHFKEIDQLTGVELRSILSVPLRVKQKEIGVLQLGDVTVGRFDTADLALIEALAATAAIAIENARLYEQARQDAATKATLLREVNHRVKNNLSAIIGLIYAEQRHADLKDQVAYQSILGDLSDRVQGLARAHVLLSAAGWTPLLLDKLAEQIVRTALRTLPRHKHISVEVTPSPIRVTPRQASDLALVITELATNTAKHALSERNEGCIDIHIALEPHGEEGDETVLLRFRDDGPGYPPEVLTLESHNVGLYLVQSLVGHNLRGELALDNDDGAVTTIRFKRATDSSR
jgi:two-component sensor histidine kinase